MSTNTPHVAVVGAGLMGHGIAQVFAMAGHVVTVHDPSVEALASLRDRIRSNLEELRQPAASADRVYPVETLGDAVAGADVVFEAGPERLESKQALFEQIERHAHAHALLASNTSVIPITRIARTLRTRDRVMGAHWWNPPYLVPLVEVVKAADTDPGAAAAMVRLLQAAGKTPVMVEKDVPGFVGNRLQHALWREAIALVEEGVCDAATVDTVVKAGFGRRLAVLGPLENADLVGTDLTLAIHETVLPAISRSPEPSDYLRQLVERGQLGMKSGEGFHRWTPQAKAELRQRVFRQLASLNGPQAP